MAGALIGAAIDGVAFAADDERLRPGCSASTSNSFTRKGRYATTFANLETRRVFDVQLGRSEAALHRFLDELSGKEHTQVVCIDLSETYRALVKRYFPNALIVADRFHVIRLVNQYLMEAWKQLEPVGRKHRGLISLMRRKPENLAPKQQLRLAAYFAEHPLVGAVYDKLQSFMALLRHKHQTARNCRGLISQFLYAVEELRKTPMAVLKSLAATMWSWRNRSGVRKPRSSRSVVSS